MFRSALLFILLATPLCAQGSPPNVRIPFHTSPGMIVLDARVNGKPAVLLLDTGCAHTMVSLQSAGISAPLNPATTGFAVSREIVRTKISLGTAEQFQVEAVNLSAIGNSLPFSIDGILGEDVLQEFSAVRIDYKAHVIEFEQ